MRNVRYVLKRKGLISEKEEIAAKYTGFGVLRADSDSDDPDSGDEKSREHPKEVKNTKVEESQSKLNEEENPDMVFDKVDINQIKLQGQSSIEM